jgi:hypothetical protein
MTARRLGAAAPALVLAACAALTGCGSGSSQRTPAVANLPLVAGARVAAQERVCDPGSSAYCAIELVVVDSRYPSSDALDTDEGKHLQSLGWKIANGDTGLQSAANSPNHKLRVTYATAINDLRGIDFRWITRAEPITVALSNSMFDRTAAMSMMLEEGGT